MSITRRRLVPDPWKFEVYLRRGPRSLVAGPAKKPVTDMKKEEGNGKKDRTEAA